MGLESYIKNKKKQKNADKLDIGNFVITQSEEVVKKFIEELKPKLIKETQDIIKENIQNLIKNVKKGDQGIQGVLGATGEPGSDGKDGIDGRAGKDGKTGTDGLNGKDGKLGKDGNLIKPNEIAKKINTLKEVIEPKTIKGLTDTFKKYSKAIAETGRTIGASGGGLSESVFVDDETPTGTVNGINKIFTWVNTPKPLGSLKVFVNGMRMRITEDYTQSGNITTFITAPPTDSIILGDYHK